MEPKPKIKVVVGINSLTEAQYPAYNNHIQLFYRMGRDNPEMDLALVNPSRTSIDSMRNLAAALTVQGKFDYLLFVDDDVLVPPGALQRLVEADADIAAGDVIIRGYPFDHMAFKYTSKAKTHLTALPDWVGSFDRLYHVDAVGFSLCLIKRTLLEKVQIPYFLTGPNHTEDIYFCIKAREAVPECSIVVDTELVCGHILWPEIISMENRKNYKEYFEKQNPETVKGVKTTTLAVSRVPDGYTYENVMRDEMRRRGVVC